ncbi:hypothetical protein [Streptomyces sp. 3211.6]|uniref:hypothetical protein n=1 Tax=Streptomyces sp. 3211.6 TaxID=1938845 RepID=UPI0011E5EDF9|nr:hypothetical protein [Streptomyces sp. 3211.6]
MLRKLRDCSPRTQAAIAASGFLVATSLSNHLNGGRIPDESLVRAFYRVIQDEVSAAGTAAVPLPCSLEELLELRRLARVQHCSCVPHPRAAPPGGSGTETPASPVSEPAPVRPSLRAGRRRLRHGRALTRTAVFAASARQRVPVPLQEGDRPRALVVDTDWTEMQTLTGFLSDGRRRDAGLLLWRAGRTLSAPELVEAISSCRAAGLDEAAESVLTSASERADKQAVLNIVAALRHAGREEDVEYLLTAATRDQ